MSEPMTGPEMTMTEGDFAGILREIWHALEPLKDLDLDEFAGEVSKLQAASGSTIWPVLDAIAQTIHHAKMARIWAHRMATALDEQRERLEKGEADEIDLGA